VIAEEVDFDFFVAARVVVEEGRVRFKFDDDEELEGDGEGFKNPSNVEVDTLRGVAVFGI